MTQLRIVADENIPALDALFGDLGEIIKLPGRDMSADDLAGADILLVRSVTKVNRELLAKSRVKFVGTCTIGTDHLDKAFLDESAIRWSAAPGCNAGGVVQYALAAMATYSPDWRDKTVGIIGCGNVGGRLYRTLKALGVSLKVSDPFKTRSEVPDLATLDEVLGCDIICVHTPLTLGGEHPTEDLINANNLPKVNPEALLISAGRGEVIDNAALLEHLKSVPSLNVVLDVWQGEPDIYTPLVPFVRCGTPHIAGYSYEGKLNGSLLVFKALAKHLAINEAEVNARVDAVKDSVLGEPVPLEAPSINAAVLATYDLPRDHELIVGAVNSGEPMKTAFDKLRKAYWQRRELGHYYCPQASGQVYEFLQLVNSVQQ